MLTNRMTAVLVATFASFVSATNAEAQVPNNVYYPSAGVRYYPAGWNNAPRAVNTIGSRAYCAPCNTGCSNRVRGVPNVVGTPFYGGVSYDAYGRRVQPVYYRAPNYRPVVTYPSRGYAVPANSYRGPVQNGYGRPVIINTGRPVNGGLQRPGTISAPIPNRGNGPMGSPFYP